MEPPLPFQAWQERRQQWERFHAWERLQRDTMIPADRLAAIGVLVSPFHRFSHGNTAEHDRTQRLTADASGITILHHRLASLSVTS